MPVYNTFWDIINNQGIEIPPIQRDYAQGRKSEKINIIRKKFIDSLFIALKNDNPLRLDFIYGKIYGIRNEEEHRRNKQAIDSLLRSVKDYASSIDLTFNELEIKDKSLKKEDLVYLIPLDGQQRLTALFLLHWYFSKKLKIHENFVILKRFKYKTRKSSLSFINLICSDVVIDFNKPLDEEVKNLEHFSNTWLDDPTVNSMIEVLNSIHERFKFESNDDIANLWERLTVEKKIYFDFLNLKDFNLSDELYVKMNARGKQLSDFENFKAWLFGEIEDRQLFETRVWDEYLIEFDIHWNDIFWNQKESDSFEIDDVYFNYFKLLFVYDLLQNINLNGTNFEDSSYLNLVVSIQENKVIDFENKFDDLFFNNLQKYFTLLEICSTYIEAERNYLVEFYNFYFSKVGFKPSWNSLVKNYIILSYLLKKNKKLVDFSEVDFSELDDYVRILNNLYRNTIIDNPSLYKSAINEIDEITYFLGENDFDISKWIEQLEYKTKSVFQKHQIEEEILKFRLLNQDNEWKALILEAENIPYFEGQLNFWFYLSEISILKNEFNTEYLNSTHKLRFREVSSKIKLMFDDKEFNRREQFSERIFERALLSKTDYLLNEGGYKCFGRNTGRDVSWKRLFLRDRNVENVNIALKEIFELDFDNVKESFQSYIESNQMLYSNDKWRKAFIENKLLFDFVGNQKYIRKIENHGWVIIKDSYKTYIGPHYELFSLDFYLKYLLGKQDEFLPFNESGYYPSPKNNIEDFPHAFLNWRINGFSYVLDIYGSENKLTLYFFTISTKITAELKATLFDLQFKENESDFSIEFENETETVSCIKNLGKHLSKLIYDLNITT